ncbi:hypothetical protein K437DRAFT_266634 [Tilletiaria anomala UBC 951]|uniref:Arrestin C-terminal-like domain-containing protein n=1 Tax=Tilletiaria anomala (strain ATCC 24038 / CBS 436.72 / UBC 951) TaxID=1037660 RepID=A0A066WIS8_TILAU|nr:uncharacterized protein K437DRAFT_266634 [Tilletiaria anomala UBC 951]KDN52448.1 hypothetical protein K437DRAFT_266634 [Tilletiaria anomala UBC 951]
MLSSLFQPCEIKLHLLQNSLFLHPPDRTTRGDQEALPPTSQDELVRGLVELWVPSERHIGGIKVKLKGVQTIGILDSATSSMLITWEDTVVLEKTLEIGVAQKKGKEKEKGRSKSRHASPERSAPTSASRLPLIPHRSDEDSSHHSHHHHHHYFHRSGTSRSGTLTPTFETPDSPRYPTSTCSSREEHNADRPDLLYRGSSSRTTHSGGGHAGSHDDHHAVCLNGDASPSHEHRERERDKHRHSIGGGGLASAIAAAMSRGRSASRKPGSNSVSVSARHSPNSSRAPSRANSRSRPASRVASRAPSPAPAATAGDEEGGDLLAPPLDAEGRRTSVPGPANVIGGSRVFSPAPRTARSTSGTIPYSQQRDVSVIAPDSPSSTSERPPAESTFSPPRSQVSGHAEDVGPSTLSRPPTGRGGIGSTASARSAAGAEDVGRASLEDAATTRGRGGLGSLLSRPSLENGLSSRGSSSHDNAGGGSSASERASSAAPQPTRGRGGLGNSNSNNSSSSSTAHHDAHKPATRSASVALPLFGGRGKDRAVSRGRGPVKDVDAPSADRSTSIASASAASESATDGSGLQLSRGVHGFEFAFIIPADTPPYERSPFGRVRYTIKATALGAGRAKSNVEAHRDIFPIVNPSSDNVLTPMTVLYNDLHPTVGLLSITCTSSSVSVGGIFNVDVHSPNPPSDLIVYLVRVILETTIELHTRKKGKQSVPTQRHKLWERGWVPPRPNDHLGPGDGNKAQGFIRDAGTDHAWTVQTVARIPDDNVIRATTMPGSRAGIRFSHTLVVEVVHSRSPAFEGLPEGSERKLKVFALRQPVIIPSCCVAYHAVTLPEYSESDNIPRSPNMPYDIGIQHIGEPGAPATLPPDAPWANTALPQHGSRHDYCVCGQTIADLTARERALIPRMAGMTILGDHVHNRGKIGELPEPEPVGERLRRSLSRSSSRSHRSASVTRGGAAMARSISRSSRISTASSATLHTEGITIVGSGAMVAQDRSVHPGAEPGSFDAPPSYCSVQECEEEPRGRSVAR